jgi:hypothetical protein
MCAACLQCAVLRRYVQVQFALVQFAMLMQLPKVRLCLVAVHAAVAGALLFLLSAPPEHSTLGSTRAPTTPPCAWPPPACTHHRSTLPCMQHSELLFCRLSYSEGHSRAPQCWHSSVRFGRVCCGTLLNGLHATGRSRCFCRSVRSCCCCWIASSAAARDARRTRCSQPRPQATHTQPCGPAAAGLPGAAQPVRASVPPGGSDTT